MAVFSLFIAVGSIAGLLNIVGLHFRRLKMQKTSWARSFLFYLLNKVVEAGICEGCSKSVAVIIAIMMIFCALWRMKVSILMTGAGSGTPIFLKRESRRQLSMVGVIIIFFILF
jgi:hypothetical protein